MLHGDSLKRLAIRIGTVALYTWMTTAGAQEWLPVSAEELQMTSEPKAPGAAAIYLYRQIDRDDDVSNEVVYERIKILTEEGRKYGDVEIPYVKGRQNIRGIRARTIRPDGSIVEFNGQVFEKPIVQSRGTKLNAKTLTLSDVQVGGIIEYRYTNDMPNGFVYDSRWILSEELFTKHAKFSLNPSSYFTVRYSWPVGLPTGTQAPAKERGKIRLETRDVPAFVTEDYMPPEDQLKYRVDFIYLDGSNNESEPTAFWKKFGKQSYKRIEDYMDNLRVIQQAVTEITAPADSPEIKLRKLYARTLQLRNLSFERSRSAEEVKREDLKDRKTVADVWRLGYGNDLQISCLYLALARAAGVEAHLVFVSTRDDYFFSELLMNPWHLNDYVVQVKLDGKDTYLDPSTPFTPFGMLPWNKTVVKGLRLDKDGGSWISTPISAPADSRTVRKANLKLNTGGTLEGTVTVTHTGLEALRRRLDERNEDETERKETLERDLGYDIPSGATITLTNKPDWTSAETPLVAEYTIRVGGWASRAGQRMLLTVGLFGQGEKNTFKHAARVHPLYFRSPTKSEDDVSIELPTGWQASAMPPAHTTDLKVLSYSFAADNQAGVLRLKRDLTFNLVLLDKKYYSQLRDFFQTVRSQDETQIVLAPIQSMPPAKR